MELISCSTEGIGGASRRSIHNARHRWSSRRGLRVVLRSGDHEGVGEASPLPGYYPEELPAVEQELRAFLAALDESPERPDIIEERCSSLVSPSARFAVETAMLDLLARARSCPLHRLFRGESTEILRSGLLQSASLEEIIEEALEKRARGVRCLKLKVGGLPIEEELHRIRALSSALGSSVTFRLDANGTLSVDQVRSMLSGLVGVSIDVFEEPVSPEQWSDLYGYSILSSPGEGSPLWAADESLGVLASEHLASSAVGALVLKPAVLGFFGALRLGEEGVLRGKKLIVTHLFDGPVALAAACELALSLPPEALLPCGLDEHDALDALGSEEVQQLRRPGAITAAPGVGLSLGG